MPVEPLRTVIGPTIKPHDVLLEVTTYNGAIQIYYYCIIVIIILFYFKNRRLTTTTSRMRSHAPFTPSVCGVRSPT